MNTVERHESKGKEGKEGLKKLWIIGGKLDVKQKLITTKKGPLDEGEKY